MPTEGVLLIAGAAFLAGILIGGWVIGAIYRSGRRRTLGEAWIHYPRATEATSEHVPDDPRIWGYGGVDHDEWSRADEM